MADFRIEFPDFPAADMPTIPAGFEDVSWHNNMCPSFASDAFGLEIWIDFANPAKREYEGEYPRFSVSQQRNGVEYSGPSIQADSWDEILAFVESCRKTRIDELSAQIEAESLGQCRQDVFTYLNQMIETLFALEA